MNTAARGHRRWVRICHWLAAASFMTLAVSGFFILMVHPRLYLGHAGNDLMPALLTLPISNNYRPDELQRQRGLHGGARCARHRRAQLPIFNQNGWARSLHFLAAWILVVVGAIYACDRTRQRPHHDVTCFRAAASSRREHCCRT